MVINSLIALDQLLNTFYADGYPDETISARCWRMRHIKSWENKRKAIDWVALKFFKDANHCYKSYLSELNRAQLPASYSALNAINKT